MNDSVTREPEGALSGAGASAGPRVRSARELIRLLAFSTFDNPVLVKELRTRMRGARAYWLMLGYTLFLAGVLGLMYFTMEAEAAQGRGGLGGGVTPEAARDLGRTMYLFVFIAQAVMVALITPALTSGAITIEREQRSYELLSTTPLKPGDVVRGKLIASVSFVVLLLTASLPLVSVSFLVGGVSPAEIASSYAIVALSAFVYGAIGLFWSATLATTAVATVLTYLSVLSFFVLTVVPGSIAASIAMGTGAGTPEIPFKSLNPLTAAFQAVHPEYLFQTQLPSWVSGVVMNLLLGLTITTAAMHRLEHFYPPRALWVRLFATLTWCAGWIFFLGAINGSTAFIGFQGTVAAALAQVLMVVLTGVAAVAPVFNTGELVVRRGESALGRYFAGWLPHRLFRDDLSCGLPLLTWWTLAAAGLALAGLWLSGHSIDASVFSHWLRGVFVIFSVLLGLVGLGNLLSVVLPSRWAACVLTYLGAVLSMVLPYFALVPYQGLWSATTRLEPVLQVLYLSPFEALREIGDPAGFWSGHPVMAFGRAVPFWVVTSVLHLLGAALFFALTLVLIRRAEQSLGARPAAVGTIAGQEV
ncbi:MAG: ABC transporter permease [Armatimonadota bacterium]